jgi:hypothetical protein
MRNRVIAEEVVVWSASLFTIATAVARSGAARMSMAWPLTLAEIGPFTCKPPSGGRGPHQALTAGGGRVVRLFARRQRRTR